MSKDVLPLHQFRRHIERMMEASPQATINTMKSALAAVQEIQTICTLKTIPPELSRDRAMLLAFRKEMAQELGLFLLAEGEITFTAGPNGEATANLDIVRRPKDGQRTQNSILTH